MLLNCLKYAKLSNYKYASLTSDNKCFYGNIFGKYGLAQNCGDIGNAKIGNQAVGD